MARSPVLLVLALGACAGPPLVDMTNVDPVVYQRDLDGCESTSDTADAAGPLVAGAIMGATIGAGLGALAAAPLGADGPGIPLDVGYGAAAGTAAGAGLGAATERPLAVPPPGPRPSVAQCLTAHGYKVITPGT